MLFNKELLNFYFFFNSFVITCTFVICSVTSYAQSRYRDHKWENPAIYENIPDTFSGHDAITIHRSKDIIYSYDPKTLKVGYVLKEKYKVKILTIQGIMDHAAITLFSPKLKVADARIIRKDGSVTDFASENIKPEKKSDKSDINTKDQYYIFNLPGIYIDDQIEFVFEAESDGFTSDEAIFLNSNLFSLLSQTRIWVPNEIECEIRTYNGLPAPVKRVGISTTVYHWNLTNVPGIYFEENSLPTSELPFLRYSLVTLKHRGDRWHKAGSYPLTGRSWEYYVDRVMLYSDELKIKGSKDSRYKEFLSQKLDDSTISNKTILEKFLYVHNFIRDSIRIEKMTLRESLKPLGTHFNDRKMDSRNLMFCYSQLFDKLDQNFYVGFLRNKHQGSIDPGLLSPEKVTDIFIAFEYEGRIYFFFLKDEKADYALGEIPYQFQGCKAVLISKKDLKDGRIKIIELPRSDTKDNFYRESTLINFIPDQILQEFETKISVGGEYSLQLRNDFRSVKKSKNEIKGYQDTVSTVQLRIDSASVSGPEFIPPYLTKYTVNGQVPFFHEKLDTNVYSIFAGTILPISLKINDNKNRTLDYYFEFPFQYTLKKYLRSDNRISLSENESMVKKIANDFGEAGYKITSLNEHTILFEAHLEINKIKVPKNNYTELIKLRDLLNELDTKRVFIKVSHSQSKNTIH